MKLKNNTFTKYPFGNADVINAQVIDDDVVLNIKSTKTLVFLNITDDTEISCNIPNYFDGGSELYLEVDSSVESEVQFTDGFTTLTVTVPIGKTRFLFVYDGINFNDFSSTLESSSGGLIDVTYSELVTLINSNGLVPLQQYKITDFQTVHYILNTSDVNIGSIEPLICLATTTNTIDKELKSVLYPEDVIYYDWNPDNWTIDYAVYDLDNIGLIVPDFKGFIYRRHDTKWNNDLPYDFRNVKFRRWNDGDVSGKYFGITPSSNGVTDSNDFIDVKTFDIPDVDYNNGEVKNNIFNSIVDNSDDYYSNGSILLNNVFYLKSDDGYPQMMNNVFRHCYENTFFNDWNINNNLNHCYKNIIKKISGYHRFEKNTINSQFYNNIIVGSFQGNTFSGFRTYENNFGNNFYSNVINGTIRGNTFGNNFYRNFINARLENITTMDGPTTSNSFRYCFFNGQYINSILINNNIVLNNFSKDISPRPNGTLSIRYYNDADELVIVNANV